MERLKHILLSLSLILSAFVVETKGQEISYSEILDHSGETFIPNKNFAIGKNGSGAIVLADRIILNKEFPSRAMSNHLVIVCKELIVEKQVALRLAPTTTLRYVDGRGNGAAWIYDNDDWKWIDPWSSLSILAEKIVLSEPTSKGMLTVDLFSKESRRSDASNAQVHEAYVSIVADSLLSIDATGKRTPVSISESDFIAVNRYGFRSIPVGVAVRTDGARDPRSARTSSAGNTNATRPTVRVTRKKGGKDTTDRNKTARGAKRNTRSGANSITSRTKSTDNINQHVLDRPEMKVNSSRPMTFCNPNILTIDRDRVRGANARSVFYQCIEMTKSFVSIDQRSDNFLRRPGVREAISIWTVSQLNILYNSLLEAQAKNDFAKEIELLNKYQEYASERVLPANMDEFQYVVTKLNELRDSRNWKLRERTIAVDSPVHSLPSISLFTEGATLETRMAPTNALVVPHQNSSRSVLGLIEFDRKKGDAITMMFDIMLTTDPWLSYLVESKLERQNESLAGMFTNWTLSPHEVAGMGIAQAKVEQTSGNRLQVSLTLHLDNAAIVLWKLFNDSGLPLMFNWEYRNGSSYEEGQWQSPPISLTRRSTNDLDIQDGYIYNRGRSTAFIEYVRIGEDRFERLFSDSRSVLSIPPGESASLPASLQFENDISIPAEAVSYEMDHTHFDEEFHVINGADVIQKMTVANRLPAFDEELGGRLDYVEVTLTDMSSANRDENQVTFRLAPSGSDGDETTIPFIKSVQGAPTFSISGRAFYEHGEHALSARETQDLTYYITSDLLKGDN